MSALQARRRTSLNCHFDNRLSARDSWAVKSELVLEVTEAEEVGYCASALGYGITTQGETIEELGAMVRDAVE